MKPLSTVFEEFEKASNKEAKIDVLRKNDTFQLRAVLRGSYHPKIEYVIERVPYYNPDKASPPEMGYSNIAVELRRVYLFEKDHPNVSKSLTQEKKEKILGDILESLEAKEAIVYMNMILKKEQAKGLSYAVVKEAFPTLLP